MTDETHVDEEEFGRWYSPSAALVILRETLSRDVAIGDIVARLQAGLCRASSRHAIYTGDHEGEESFELIDKSMWAGASYIRPIDSFWNTGTVEIEISRPGFRSVYSKGSKVQYFDVRFESSGIHSAVPPGLPTLSATSDPDRRPNLSDAEQRRCAKAIAEIWGITIPDTRAVALARGMNPDHSLARDRFVEIFREFSGPKSRGRPKTSKM